MEELMAEYQFELEREAEDWEPAEDGEAWFPETDPWADQAAEDEATYQREIRL
jgi:hypothetical protein